MSDPIKCLDHGFVELVDVMGDDQAILQAARVSYQRDKQEPDEAKDRALIRYLYRNRHTTPFEMCEFKFHCQMPIFVARQWIRHRTASVNEVSARYSMLPDIFYTPLPKEMGFQSKTNKQGSAEPIPQAIAIKIAEAMLDDAKTAFLHYHEYLGQQVPKTQPDEQETERALHPNDTYELSQGGGLARELARINLPLSAYTRWYWKIDLHNLLHFLGLRLDKHAQYEIRVFAEAMASFVKARCPLAWEAFEDFKLNAMTFSAVELEALRVLIGDPSVTPFMVDWPTKREGEEFVAKIKKLLAKG